MYKGKIFIFKKQKEFIPFECTIPELVYKKCSSDRIAAIFDSEKIVLTFSKLKSEVKLI